MQRILSAATLGLKARVVEVEVDLFIGLHIFNIVGLGDKAVEESKERVSAAIKNTELIPPRKKNKRLIVNLAPADLKKQGPAYDLPIALGYLLASNQINFDAKNCLFAGELALDGQIRPVNGALLIALLCKEQKIKTLFIPKKNAQEAAMVKDLKIIPVGSLAQIIAHLENRIIIPSQPITNLKKIAFSHPPRFRNINMAYIKGQENAKRALEIAASGSHNLIMIGPPGSGKSLLAKAIPSILPRMSRKEILEITKIYSIAGKLDSKSPIVTQRPYRSPHHTASAPSLIGGGTFSKPGEISLTHRGILFLDEFPEFHRNVLESLRQPLEEGEVTVSRARGSFTYPAKFILIAAMNPCPCGYLNHPTKICTCSEAQIRRYKRKISGPLLDRIDLHVEVPQLKYGKLTSEKVAEESKSIRERVERARKIQRIRFKKEKIFTNSEMDISQIKKYCQIKEDSNILLKNAMDKMSLSARGYHRILKISKTIADLAGEENISKNHIAEALQYREKQTE